MAGRRRRKRRTTELAWEQEIELWQGPNTRPGQPPSAFANAAERRAAWFACNPAEIGFGETPGSRLWAWWHYSSPAPRDYSMSQTEQLRRMGELTEAEERELAAEELRRARIMGATGDEPETLLEAAAEEEARWAAEFDDGLW